MRKINLITVCTDAYPMVYARKIITRFKQLTNIETEVYCITDRSEEIQDLATPIKKEHEDVLGWWNKMQVYSPNMPKGWLLYLDLDIVLLQNFDDEIYDAISVLERSQKSVACVSDAIEWMGNRYSSSMMLLPSGAMRDIYRKFVEDRENIMVRPAGDQVWTGGVLNPSRVYYMDERNPNLKANLKFHLGRKTFGQWEFPYIISNKIKTVDCGGRPKPHEITDLPYITNNWHNVQV